MVDLVKYTPEPICGVTRGKKSNTRCELPVDHADRWHYGRGKSGRWFSWPVSPVLPLNPTKEPTNERG